MDVTSKKISNNDYVAKVKSFFDDLVTNIRIDQEMVENKIAPEPTQDIYMSIIDGDNDKMHSYARTTSAIYFLKKLLVDYFSALRNFDSKPLTLAVDLSEAKILVWAVIDDDDERTEDALILAEAKANAVYSDKGFHITSTIVEKSDNANIPPHYQLFQLN